MRHALTQRHERATPCGVPDRPFGWYPARTGDSINLKVNTSATGQRTQSAPVFEFRQPGASLPAGNGPNCRSGGHTEPSTTM